MRFMARAALVALIAGGIVASGVALGMPSHVRPGTGPIAQAAPTTSAAPGGGTPSPSPSASSTTPSSPSASASIVPSTSSPSQQASPSQTPAPSPSSAPSAGPPLGSASLSLTSHSSAIVSQTGDLVRYTVTATNTGDVAVDKLFVIDLVPDEVDVVSAPISPVVLATELGRHRGHEDVVWNVGSLAAGRSIDLVWTGRVAHAGDMRAVNVGVAKAAAGAVKARTATTTYVATAATPATNNPPFAPRSRRVAVEGAALARPFEAPAGAVIPFTGFDAVPWLLIAAGLAVAGAGIFATALTVPSGGPARRVDPKLLATTLGLAALLVTACTSAPTGPEAGGASPSVTGGIQVKGKVVTRRAQPSPTAATSPAPASPQAGGATTPTPETAPSPGASPTLTSPVAAVAPAAPTVKVVHIGLTDLPVAHLGSKGGDNALDYAWDENAGSIVHASSSLSFVRDEKVQLLSSLHPVHGRIVVDATIVNDSGMRRLAVDGRIRHGIVSGSRTVATLRSAPIHVVLAPHGSTSVRFSYALPTGDYSVISSFLSE